jgi:hypothetical protein
MAEPAPDPRTRPGRREIRWPEPSTRPGAILYAIIGGLVVWFLVDILPHLHIAISWH